MFLHFMKTFLGLNRRQQTAIFKKADKALLLGTWRLLQQWAQQSVFTEVGANDSLLRYKLVKKRKLMRNLCNGSKTKPRLVQKYLLLNVPLIRLLFEETLKTIKQAPCERRLELISQLSLSLITPTRGKKQNQ